MLLNWRGDADPHLKATTDSWRVDQTYVKVKKVWMYLYRAVDSEGNTLEFLLSATRDAEAAKRFFVKALYATASSTPSSLSESSKRQLVSNGRLCVNLGILW